MKCQDASGCDRATLHGSNWCAGHTGNPGAQLPAKSPERAPDSNPMHAIGYGRGDDNSTRSKGQFSVMRRCSICGSSEGVRRFAVTVDEEELRAVALLCAEHGDAHLLNVGRVLGSLFARVGDPVVDCGEPAPVGTTRCIRGHGHTGDHWGCAIENWANVGNTRVPK